MKYWRFVPFLLGAAAWGQTFTNPVFQSADPWLVHEGGEYYYSYSCKRASVCVKMAPTLSGIGAAAEKEVFTAPATGPNRSDIWAPEIHRVNGRWYIYYAGDDGGNDSHRLFVAQATTDDPLGAYTMGDTGGPNGQLMESSGHWAIDPDVFTGTDGNLYLTWSCTNTPTPAFPQNICLARMTDPLHVGSQVIQISNPTEPWEQRGSPINEGPVGFTREGKNFITYSASPSFAPNTYSVGLLTNASGRLMDASAWVKSGPIFDRHDRAFGTGSVVFTTSPDGSEWWNIYHGIERMDCQPNVYVCRDIRMQPMRWAADGMPILGYPFNPGVPAPLPSGEPGAPAKRRLGDWGASFGDEAEGHPEKGAPQGEWEPEGREAIRSRGLTSGLASIFRESNPNLPSYTVSCELRMDEASDGGDVHRYGIWAAYLDAGNFAAYAVDWGNKTLVSVVTSSGNPLPPMTCPLPADFDPSVYHALRVAKTGTNFSVALDEKSPEGPCNNRTLFFENGQAGVYTQNVRASFRRFVVAAPALPLARQPAPSGPPVMRTPPTAPQPQ